MTMKVNSLVDVIPTILGFHPSDSVAMVVLNDAGLVGPVARIDGDWVEQTADQLAASAARYGTRVVLVTYGECDPLAPLHAALAAVGVPVTQVVQLDNAPVPIHPQLAAETALLGRAVLSSREELAQAVEYRPQQQSSPPARAYLARCTDVEERDALLAELYPRRGEAIAQLLIAAQAAPDDDPRTPHLLTVLAVLAHRAHDTVTADAAVDRAIRLAPRNLLARLVRAHRDQMLEPKAIDALFPFVN